MRLILPCNLIPDGTVVCKPTGTKRYTLREKFPIRFYGENSEEIKVEFPKGVKYLVAQDDSGGVNIIENLDQELAVVFGNRDELFEFVDEMKWKQEENSK